MSKAQTGFVGRCEIHDEEFELLASAINSSANPECRVLEIGTLDGVTASLLARRYPAAVITSVDIFEQLTPEKWLANRRPNMQLWIGTAQEVAGLADRMCFDIAFVDGDHRFPQCRADLNACNALVWDRIFVHDYQDQEWPGVTKAVDLFVSKKCWAFGRQVRHLVELVRQ